MFWILQKLINFFYLLKIFFWMSTVSVVKSYLQVRSLIRAQGNWGLSVCKFLQIRMKKIPSEYKIRKDKTIFLFNHRSQADFFVHPIIIGGCTNFLARKQVALMFGIISIFFTNIIWFFNRSQNVDIQKFNQWLDRKYTQSVSPALVVYPQGHRMYDTTTVSREQVKRGMIKYAYTRQIPVQFVMTFGNEKAFNEKRLKISYGEDVIYKIGKVIDPKDFTEAKDFVNTSVEQFIRFFNETYKQTEFKSQLEDTTEQLFDVMELKQQ